MENKKLYEIAYLFPYNIKYVAIINYYILYEIPMMEQYVRHINNR